MNKPNNIEDIYPLSPMQQGILFYSLFTPDVGVYIPQICLTLEGSLNHLQFKQAWEKVLQKHSVLRTAFNWEKRDKAFQIVYQQVTLPWFEQDWQDYSSDEQQPLLNNFLEEDRQQGFDLKKPPLIRLNLIQLSDKKYYLIWTQHHIILDGWSSGLVIKDVFTLYQNQDLLPRRPYREYIAWLNQQDRVAAQQFWQNKLKGFTNPINLRIDHSSNIIGLNEQQISLSPTAFQSFTKQHQLTLNTLIQGTFAILLSYYSGEEDIIFGATSAGRSPTLMGVESMVGLFINTLPMRVQVPNQAFLIPWLQNLQTQQAETLQYEYSSLLDIQEGSDISAGLPLFESILVFENYPVDASSIQQNQDLSICEVNAVEWTSFPMTVLVGSGAELTIKIKYQCARFSSDTITRMLSHFQALLERIIINPERRLGEISMLTELEQHQLIFEWNNTQRGYSQNKCLHERFERQVEKTPEAIAVIFEDRQLTYLELNRKANRLAHYLQTLAVKPGVLVGICVERSPEMIVGILGILKAGGAYVPIDPTYPLDRQSFMLMDAKISILLTQQHLSPSHLVQNILLDNDWAIISQYSHLNPISKVTSEHDVYVIYTSGSTGKPKGVINTHQGLINRLAWMQETYQLTASDRVLQKTSISFDVSVWEIFWSLLEGSCLVLAKPNGQKDSVYLVQLIIKQQITTLHFVPSMLKVFLDEPQIKNCHSIKRVICSGEALPLELQKRFFECLDAELHNLYGPTEAAIDVTSWPCSNTEQKYSFVPLGRPIANTQIYLLDKQARLVPIGVPGEIHIGGDGLARGYFNRPDLTAEKFMPNPFQSGSRLYKTGDLARYLSDGNLEYLGRIDHQVKIRGYRIELGEIEALLTQYLEIKEAVVMMREEGENKYLVAYLIPHQKTICFSNLRHFLQQKLPNYMIPADFIILEQFPLTLNGKLDRKALPSVNHALHSFVSPRNATEEKIAAIWIEILKIEKIGIYDNFFEIGGNSILAIRVNNRLCQTFKVELPLRFLFEKTTIASLAERIDVIYMTSNQLSQPSTNSENVWVV